MYDGTVQGRADISNPTMGYQPGRFPVSEAFDLPIGFTSAKAASLALYDYLMKNKPKEFEQTKILTAFTAAPANIMASRPVKFSLRVVFPAACGVEYVGERICT
jgi:TRAP-type C4-dicarboxylate transport system substrate-binding protein